MRARLKVEGMKEAVSRIDAVGERAMHLMPQMRSPSIRHDINESESRRFAKQTGWKRDTPKWIAEKRRRGLDPRTLRATGALERALTQATFGASKGLVYKPSDKGLTWGITPGRGSLYYATPLAKGTSRHPARRMVVIDKVARSKISGHIEHYVATGIIE